MSECDDWIAVAVSRQRWRCHDQSLVLDALGIPNRVVDGPRHSALLLVPPGLVERARQELELYARENVARQPSPAMVFHGYGIPGVLVYVILLLLVFLGQQRYFLGVDWPEAGMLDGLAVRNGEWWRIVTALTLHGDGAHLAANILFGVFFGAFAGQYLGSGLAWAAILVAAALGNALDMALTPPTHRALGASTAVFAALGLVAAFVWLTSARRALGWARRWAPVVGAVFMLAWIGTGDERTDVVAHLTGFLAGFAAGALLGWRLPAGITAPGSQLALGTAALLAVAGCWWLAVAAAGRGLA